MGRSAAGSVLGRVTPLEAEADAAVVHEDAGRAGDQVGAEAAGVRVDQRYPHAIAIDRTEVSGVAGRHGRKDIPGPVAVDGGPTGRQPLRGDQRLPIGPVVEDRHTIVAGLGSSLDQQVGPDRVVGIVGEVQSIGDPRGRQSQVALRRGRHGPHLMTPSIHHDRLDPPGL